MKIYLNLFLYPKIKDIYLIKAFSACSTQFTRKIVLQTKTFKLRVLTGVVRRVLFVLRESDVFLEKKTFYGLHVKITGYNARRNSSMFYNLEKNMSITQGRMGVVVVPLCPP